MWHVWDEPQNGRGRTKETNRQGPVSLGNAQIPIFFSSEQRLRSGRNKDLWLNFSSSFCLRPVRRCKAFSDLLCLFNCHHCGCWMAAIDWTRVATGACWWSWTWAQTGLNGVKAVQKQKVCWCMCNWGRRGLLIDGPRILAGLQRSAHWCGGKSCKSALARHGWVAVPDDECSLLAALSTWMGLLQDYLVMPCFHSCVHHWECLIWCSLCWGQRTWQTAGGWWQDRPSGFTIFLRCFPLCMWHCRVCSESRVHVMARQLLGRQRQNCCCMGSFRCLKRLLNRQFLRTWFMKICEYAGTCWYFFSVI